MLAALAALAAIFRDNLLPVFLLLAIGFVLQRRIGLDLKTLARVNLYVFVPALACYALSQAELALADLGRVVAFVLGLEALMFGLARIWGRLRGYPVGLGSAFACALMFYNSGNFGYPLMALLYGDGSRQLGLQAIVLATQNASLFTIGQVIIRGPKIGAGAALAEYFKMPFFYALLLGLALQQTAFELPAPVMKAIQLAAGGLVPLALLTLGAQLAQVRWGHAVRSVGAAAVGRLVGGPVLAYLLLRGLGWHGWVAEMLLISSAVPTAVNTSLLAIEADNEPDFAAQVVFVTTLASALTVAVTIYVARAVFGA